MCRYKKSCKSKIIQLLALKRNGRKVIATKTYKRIENFLV